MSSVTYVLWTIWDVKFDGGIPFEFDPKKGQGQVK